MSARRSDRSCAKTIPARSRSSWSTIRARTAPPRWRAAPPSRPAAPTGSRSSQAAICRPDGPASSGPCGRASLRTKTGRSRPTSCWFSDADIAYAPGVLRRLVAGAVARGTVLTSLMVKLRCESAAERLLIPAFVFFFQKLYPFAWVNDPGRRTAAAAGGCMLVRRAALAAAGGLEAIRGAIIDDCALGALMKRQGPIWLGLTADAASLRAYPAFGDIRRMVARSAYAELDYSPAAAGRRRRRHGARLPDAAARHGVRDGCGAGARGDGLGPHGPRLPADPAPLSSQPALGVGAAGHRRHLYGLHGRLGRAALARSRRRLEGPRSGHVSRSAVR